MSLERFLGKHVVIPRYFRLDDDDVDEDSSHPTKKRKRKRKNRKSNYGQECQPGTFSVERGDGEEVCVPTGGRCHESDNHTTQVHPYDDVNKPILHNKSIICQKETSKSLPDPYDATHHIESPTVLSDLLCTNSSSKQERHDVIVQRNDASIAPEMSTLEAQVSGVVISCQRNGSDCFIRRHDNGNQISGHHKSIAEVNANRLFHEGDILLFDVVYDGKKYNAVNILIGIPSSS